MSEKYIVIPRPVLIGQQPIRDPFGNALPDGSGGVLLEELTYSFKQCVTYVVDNDEVFASPASSIRAGARILEALDTDKPYFVLRDADHKLLDKSFEEPSSGYGNWVNSTVDEKGVRHIESVRIVPRTFLPFINAVNEPVNTEPKHLLPPPPPPSVPMPETLAAVMDAEAEELPLEAESVSAAQ